jgi:soluble lytic murein transglycosylase-like protein
LRRTGKDGLSSEPGAAASRPAGQGADRVSELLFAWETRHLSPLRRSLVAWWARRRRPLLRAGTGVALVLLGVAMTTEPPPEEPQTPAEARLLQQLRETRSALQAREGELELARLEMNRLSAIMENSRRHRIPADLAAAIHDIAVSEGIDPALAFSLVRVESGFSRSAVSSAGAVGLTQVMPSTARWLQPDIAYSELFERDTNLRLGFRYLRMLIQQYRGDLHLALLAYNRGPNRVDDILRAGGDPSNGYTRMIRAGMDRKALTGAAAGWNWGAATGPGS